MTLRDHMRDLHPNVPRPRSNEDLVRAHKRQHHRYDCSHVHGTAKGSGPDDRPPGWTTGEDVKLRAREQR